MSPTTILQRLYNLSPRRTACIFASALAAAILVASCTLQAPPTQATMPAGTAPAPAWYLGADISALAGGRGGGGAGGYLDTNNTPGSEISIMYAHGWNAFRLRVFLSPVRSAPNNTLENTITLAKQIKAAGAMFMLDIHYSDTWADPQHQETPVAWRNLTVEQVEQKVEEYTKDVLTQLKATGATPDMVQVGNEITGGTLWPQGHVQVPLTDVKTGAGAIQPLPIPYDDQTQWSNFTRFIKAGTRGVRAVTPGAKIIIHIDCGGDWVVTKWFFDHFTEAGVDYDIIGQSFYPNYHGTLAMMQQNLAETFNRYHKPIIIAETGYPQSGAANGKYMQWPGTPQGQLQFMADLVNTVQRDPHSMGVFYWAPEGRGRGNGMWTTTGTPAPSIMVLDHLKDLTTQPASKMPEAPATATQPK